MKINYFVAVLFLFLSFSCKKEDDKIAPTQPSTQAKLVGTWQCKKVYKKEPNSFGQAFETFEFYYAGGPILHFGAQGELEEGYFAGGKFKADVSGNYKLNGQDLKLFIPNARILYFETPTIDTLTANHLSLTDTIFYLNNKQNYTILSIDAYR